MGVGTAAAAWRGASVAGAGVTAGVSVAVPQANIKRINP
jgi:hypothetical protein